MKDGDDMPEPENQKDIDYYIRENRRLVEKSNAQLDYILQLLEEKKQADIGALNKANPYMALFQTFFFAVSDALKAGLFHEMKRDTESSRKYNIIEAKEFRALIKKYAPEIGAKKMLEKWCDFGLVARFANGRIDGNYTTGSSKSIRIVRVNKEAVELVKEAAIKGEV